MAWRPYENLIDGELDNRTPGKVTGWMRFYRNGESPLRVSFDLDGDFHEDIRGTMIRLRNRNPSDRYQDSGTYMEGFEPKQRGTAGDITAGLPLGPWTEELARELMAQHEVAWRELGITGAERGARRRKLADEYRRRIDARELFFPYVSYPYIEWYAANGRVVLELDTSQVEIVGARSGRAKSPAELHADEKKRTEAFGSFMANVAKSFSDEDRDQGGDGNVTSIVVG